jgi:tripartite-type tricarboxylate transporter receptor subunit TctC
MEFPRRKFLQLAAGAAALPMSSLIAQAQAYPTRPVRIIVPFGPGGGGDIIARIMAQWLSERLGQPFVIENRPGAATNIAVETVLRSPPDGYTLLLAASANAVNASLYENLPFNFIRDIAPVASINRVPFVMLVNSSISSKSVPEFIAYAKANPGKIRMATTGAGLGPQMSGELFTLMAGVDMLNVPYRGGDAPALVDLLSGQVQVYFATMLGSIEHIKAGRVRALAVTTAARQEMLPDVPALSEFVTGYEASGWNGIGAPKNTSVGIIKRLNEAVNAGLADPQIKERLAAIGAPPISGPPEEFGKFITDETEKWGKVIRAANIKPE